MSRPLMAKSAVELDAAVERNRANAAELKLILDELRHRKTVNARGIEAKAKKYLAQIEAARENERTARSRFVHMDVRAGVETARASVDARTPEKAAQPELPRLAAAAPPHRPEAQKMTEARRWTEEAVARLRTKLIDLSRKSPLISFKHGGRSASILRFVDERPDLLYGAIQEDSVGFEPLPGEDETPKDELTPAFHIAYERARLTDEDFLAATEKLGDDEHDARAWQEAERALRSAVRQQLGLPPLNYGKTLDVVALARAHGFDPSYDLKASDDDDVQPHHQDDRIRVLLTAKELDKRLKAIWERYRGHGRETGLHTLFLALGFVQWFDETAPDTPLHAPLLLIAVELERRVLRGRYEYTLRSQGEGLQVNVALAEKMRQHWRLELPELRDGETPESYFIRIADLLQKGERLSLRRFATLAVLPFPRMVLWKDLDPAVWPEAAFASHRLLPGILGATPMAGDPSPVETIDLDGGEWADKAPALVRPADASQHSALIDMVMGHDLAIEGPPGTGKSETITNMIAAAVAAGKRVLFVAEKQAALRVVADRLRASGLGPLLLELHGDNANRADVYEGLRHRQKARASFNPGVLASQRQQLRQQRDMLRRYLALIDQKLGATDRSAYWLVWREIQLRARVENTAVERMAASWRPDRIVSVDPAELADRRGRLAQFGAALAALDRDAERGERTAWTLATALGRFDQRPQLNAAASASAAAAAVEEAQRALEALAPLRLPAVDGPLEATAEQLAGLRPFEPVEEAVARTALCDPDRARALLRQQSRWRQLCGKLAEDVAAPEAIPDEVIVALADALSAAKPVEPDTAGFREALGHLRKAAATAEEMQTEQEKVTRSLRLAPGMSVVELRAALNAAAMLEREPTAVTVLYRLELLDPLAEAALFAQRSRSAALADERGSLAELIHPEALEADPAALEGLADVLADSGVFTRLFGGQYKAAKRRSARLVRDSQDRIATADLLRRVARNLGQAAQFKADSPVAAWFPPLLWKGIDTDWDSVQRARAALIEARRIFAKVRADEAMEAWLALSPDTRARLAASANRLVPWLEKAEALDRLGGAAEQLARRLTARRDTLDRVETTLEAAGALPSGLIVRDGEDLPSRLLALRAAATEFDTLRRTEGLEWVESVDSSLDRLARALTHADELRSVDGPLHLVDALVAAPAPVSLLGRVLEARGPWLEACRMWLESADQLSRVAGLEPEAIASDWPTLARRLAGMATDQSGARLAANLLGYRTALGEVGLASLGELAMVGGIAPEGLADLYELLLLRALLARYLGGEGAELGRLGSLTLESARKEFSRIDQELHGLEAQAILAQRLRDDAPSGVGWGPRSAWTDLALLDHELALKRPRTPIRDVVHRAGAALQALQPVWMMSPTSAAQYIRPGSLQFDLLVIDEASQMRPEYAISAILRGGQFVVVGDANQLPPSDHFQTAADDSGDDDDGLTQNTESILDLANQRLRRKRRLKWHYRSQHESLIQFSNREFYDRDLVVFPSPMGNEDELLGVKCRYVKGAVYEASINQREAEAVIEEAFRLMRTYPQHSIGIAAMNAKQTELIQNEFDRLILEQPEVRRYVEEFAGGLDEFFIKNLENVQGDERDIILISTVYGPGKDGNVTQHFGLMNREVGWRRLNVLVTRAKLSTRLFTSLRPDDVKLTATSSRGVRTLKNYLTYAHHGAIYDDATGGEPDSDFETVVAERLRSAGFEVVHQVGVEGFRIDLGIRHADYPIGFIAGIECDGASFHSGLTVRDRDRIRQSVLENMGWRIYRIWSTDWFADPERETRRLLEWLEEKRSIFAYEYARRPKQETKTGDESDVERNRAAATGSVIVAEPAAPPGIRPAAENVRTRPEGPALRSLGDFDWYETSKGYLYEIWLEEGFAGEVEVLSRATSTPRLYGGQAIVARSEYAARVEMTGERFKSHDLYAAVREVARRATQSIETE